jgi:hypothetical protein
MVLLPVERKTDAHPARNADFFVFSFTQSFFGAREFFFWCGGVCPNAELVAAVRPRRQREVARYPLPLRTAAATTHSLSFLTAKKSCDFLLQSKPALA